MLYSWAIISFQYIPHFYQQCICWLTDQFFSISLLEYISIATISKGYKYFCSGVWTIWVYAYEWNSWVIWWCCFDFWGPCKVFSIIVLPPMVIKFPLWTYLIQYLLSFFLMTRWVILQSSFNFHFLEDYGCWILLKTVFLFYFVGCLLSWWFIFLCRNLLSLHNHICWCLQGFICSWSLHRDSLGNRSPQMLLDIDLLNDIENLLYTHCPPPPPFFCCPFMVS